MEFQDLKRWHWMLAGLIAGLALSYAFSDHDVDNDPSLSNREIKQPIFEREAFSRSRDSHEPVLQNIKIEPPVPDFAHHLQRIVRGERLMFSEKYQKEFRVPFYYYAADPYVPVTYPVGTDPAVKKGITTVMDFLALAQKTVAVPAPPAQPAPWQGSVGLHYRYAWEYESRWNTLLWAVGGMLLIGGVWPSFLNALVTVGLGKPPKVKDENAAYLDSFASGAEAKTGVKVVAESEHTRLDELNAALEKGLAPSGTGHSNGAVDEELPDVPVRVLGEGAYEPDVNVAASVHEPEMSEEERKKRYAAGDFYPVARGPAKNP